MNTSRFDSARFKSLSMPYKVRLNFHALFNQCGDVVVGEIELNERETWLDLHLRINLWRYI